MGTWSTSREPVRWFHQHFGVVLPTSFPSSDLHRSNFSIQIGRWKRTWKVHWESWWQWAANLLAPRVVEFEELERARRLENTREIPGLSIDQTRDGRVCEPRRNAASKSQGRRLELHAVHHLVWVARALAISQIARVELLRCWGHSGAKTKGTFPLRSQGDSVAALLPRN